MSTAPGVEFYKLSGAGNDFIALVEPPRPPTAAEIRAWCRRGLSLGADGVFTLERTVPPKGGKRNSASTVRMVYFNADGGRGELCLNGSRCAARLAFHLGWGDGELRLETDSGVLGARHAGEDRIAVELPDIVGEGESRTLEVDGERYEGWYLWVGVPHLVLPWPESLALAPVADLGAVLRRHPDLGEAGANVDFVRFVAPGRCEIRTFERGVEAETLACGTGVVAAVAVGVAAGRLELPVAALTSGGYELTVRGEKPQVLEGDARIVARGELGGAGGSTTRPTVESLAPRLSFPRSAE